MINLNDYITIFEQFAAEHKLLKKFYRLDYDEILPSTSEFPCMVLTDNDDYLLSNNYSKLDSALVYERMQGCFFILDKVSDTGDFDALNNKIAQCKQIADDVIARILYLLNNDEDCCDGLLGCLDINSFSGSLKKMKLDGTFVGWSTKFLLNKEVLDDDYDETKWNL